MQIRCLIENTAISEEFESEHGLSLYIKTDKHRLLFDFGASPRFLRNAELMEVDLAQIDIGILSHGHYDHGGGLSEFLKVNKDAKILVNQKAFEKHFSKRKDEGIANIGLDTTLVMHHQIHFIGRMLKMDEELLLFSNIKERKMLPKGNEAMLVEGNEGTYIQDGFLHEQNLVVTENGKNILFAGCAHRGIINIVNQAAENLGKMPDVVVGGFHLYSRDENLCETDERITQLGELLLQTGAQFYTCHCTGMKAFHMLKEVMGEQIRYLSTGQTITI